MQLHARSRVAINATVGTVAQFTSIGIALVTTPILLEVLGTTQYGAFALIGSLTAYFGVLDLGIGGSLTRFMAFYHERGDRARIASYTTFGVIFYLGFAVVLLPIIVGLGPWVGRFLALPVALQEKFTFLLLLIFGLFVGWSLVGILIARMAAAHRLDIPGYANICGSLVFAVLVYTWMPSLRTIEGLLGCMLCQLAVVACFLLVADWRLKGPLMLLPHQVQWSQMRELFKFGIWGQLSNVTAVINLEADKVIISRGIGVDGVTPYHVANRLALLSRALPLQLLGSLLPAVTAQVSRGASPTEIARLYAQTTRSLMIPTVIIVGFVAGSADALLRLWLGHHIADAGMLCTALVISYAVNNVTGAGTVILKGEGKPQLEAFYGAVSAIFNIGLTMALIRPFGLHGVVIGTIVGNVIGSALFVWLFHRRKGFGWWNTVGYWLVRLIGAVVLAALITHGILLLAVGRTGSRLELLLALAATGVAYLAFCYLFGRVLRLWTPEDHALIGRLAGILGRRNKGGAA